MNSNTQSSYSPKFAMLSWHTRLKKVVSNKKMLFFRTKQYWNMTKKGFVKQIGLFNIFSSFYWWTGRREATSHVLIGPDEKHSNRLCAASSSTDPRPQRAALVTFLGEIKTFGGIWRSLKILRLLPPKLGRRVWTFGPQMQSLEWCSLKKSEIKLL